MRCQSIERTLAEWVWLTREVRPTYLYLRDPVFAHDRACVEAICSGIIGRGLELPWGCGSWPEHFDRELLKLLKAAGSETSRSAWRAGIRRCCRDLGRVPEAESADDYLAQVRRVADVCQQVGLTCRVFIMAGLPGQNGALLGRHTVAVAPTGSGSHRPRPRVPGASGHGIAWPMASVPDETLQLLQQGNRPPPNALQRRALCLPVRGAPRRLGPLLVTRNLPRTTALHSECFGVGGGPFLVGRRIVFLTGGNGFIGGYVARALAAAGARIVALVRPGSRSARWQNCRVTQWRS